MCWGPLAQRVRSVPIAEVLPMNTEMLEEVLACPKLPSLPAIAAKVIEMTSDPNVSIKELASVIQQDQAMAAKILRTVNSSFYGLRERCGTIDKALVLLGLAPVKSLVLGFSLVAVLPKPSEDGFDYQAYWRRSLYSGVAAREIAKLVPGVDEDEAFLAALFQDVGMMSLHMVMPDRYSEVLLQAEGDHRQLMKAELSTLEISHAEISGMLCERWKLPMSLVHPVRFHERPSAAPTDAVHAARVVALANLVHDVLTDGQGVEALRAAYRRGSEWFKIEAHKLDELVEHVSKAAKEMGKMLELDTGAAANAERLLAEAQSQLAHMNKVDPGAASVATGSSRLQLQAEPVDDLDPLTGLLAAAGLKASLAQTFMNVSGSGEPLAMAHVELGGLDLIEETGRLELADEAVLLVSMYLKKNFESLGGVVGRSGDGSFMVFVPGLGRVPMVRAAEASLEEIRGALEVMRQQDDWPEIEVNLSIGIAAWETKVAALLTSAQHVVAASVKASRAARAAGGDCLRAFVPKAAA